MAVIIQRDNKKVEYVRHSPETPPKKNHFLDTLLLYVVGFFGLIGSIYLLHLSNQSNTFNRQLESNTTFFINHQKVISSEVEIPSTDFSPIEESPAAPIVLNPAVKKG